VALTSVSSGLISPETAFPIIFGSYLGATITIVVASLGHQPAIKKQVAMGHVGFNVVVALLGMFAFPRLKLLFLNQIFPLLGEVRSLAIFYVVFRTLVAVLVFPFLGIISRFFQKYITDDEKNFTLAVQRVQSFVDPEMALLAVKQDLLVYFKEVIGYNLNIRDFYLTDVQE
jgi:Na+/phosphate symporter